MIHSPELFYADLPAGFDGEFMWDFLEGAFLNSSKPMDFDAVVEREGGFLIFETKNPGVSTPAAQFRAFRRLVEISDRFTVVFCHKRADQIKGFGVLTRDRFITLDGNFDVLCAWCRAWTQQQLDRAQRERAEGYRS